METKTQVYPPQWRAEDNFRLEHFPDTKDQFLWRPEKKGKPLPREWTNRTKSKANYAKFAKYKKHKKLLEETFSGSKKSPFKLGVVETKGVGLGVFYTGSKTISKEAFKRNKYCDLFKGYTDLLVFKTPAHSIIDVRVRKVGVHYDSKNIKKTRTTKKDVNKSPSPEDSDHCSVPARVTHPRRTKSNCLAMINSVATTGSRSSESKASFKAKQEISNVKEKNGLKRKRDEELRNLYGPMVFLNHACLCHAHTIIKQKKSSRGEEPVHIIINEDFGDNFYKSYDDDDDEPDTDDINKNFLASGKELFTYYGSEEQYPGLVCSVCKEEMKSKGIIKQN